MLNIMKYRNLVIKWMNALELNRKMKTPTHLSGLCCWWMNLRLGLDPNNLSTLCRRCPYCSHPETEWSNFLSITLILLSIKTAKEWQSSKWNFSVKTEDMRRLQNWDKCPHCGKMASIFREGDPLDSKYHEWDTSEILWPQKCHIQEIL